MFQFPNWTDQIAAISTDSQYQNLTVSLIDPANVVSTYDIDTGEEELTNDGVFWSGQARLAAIRWGTNRENNATANASVEKAILVQFPQDPNFGTENAPVYRIRKGIKLKVTASAKNPALLTYLFVCTSDIEGGNIAARTIEFAADGDAVLSDEAVPEVP